MSGIAEGVRQLRVTSVNRAPMSSTFSVAAGTGVPPREDLLSQGLATQGSQRTLRRVT
jgi:hypothetical protein